MAHLQQQFPDHSATYWAQGALAETRGKMGEARAAYSNAVARDRGNHLARYSLGQLLSGRGNREWAKAATESGAYVGHVDHDAVLVSGFWSPGLGGGLGAGGKLEVLGLGSLFRGGGLCYHRPPMDSILRFLTSSIGKKMVTAVTGLLLCFFLVGHLAGNLLLFVGQDAFNAYARTLSKNPLLIPVELVLLAILIGHVMSALRVTLENKLARSKDYLVEEAVGGRNPASATMWLTGPIILVFLVVHLYNFKYGNIIEDDLYTLVVQTFGNPAWALFYIACMLVLALHLNHGFRSAFQSLGAIGDGMGCILKCLGYCFGIVISAGFILFPLWGLLIK